MKSFLNCAFFALILCLSACNGDENSKIVEPLAADEYVWFKLDLPANWKQQTLQGTDSYVGYFTDKSDTIGYDHGAMALQRPKEIVAYYKNGKILEEYNDRGVKVTIYSYTSNKKIIGAYFSGQFAGEITSLSATNYSDQKKVIELMKTHKFVRVKR